jgi:hypothetical protein
MSSVSANCLVVHRRRARLPLMSHAVITLCTVFAFACGSVTPGISSDASTAEDASSPGGPDARACFGQSFEICLSSAPTEPLTIQSALTIDTTSSSRCVPFLRGDEYCVVAATRISIEANLRATGARPLVLLASDSIVIAAGATVDVGSHLVRAPGTPETGAGADAMACDLGTVVAPFSVAGAAGGSFAGLGGAGGSTDQGQAGGKPGKTSSIVIAPRGGCRGQDGAPELGSGQGGHGGGAVFLIAGTKIEVAGAINAGGQGGGGDTTAGGGGGGSGGFIGFDAPLVTATGLLVANGGGGGEGADGSGQASARDGADATTIAEAIGGAGSVPRGGDGGNGSAGAAGGAGKEGMVGIAGGGGGGGAGLILAPATANLGTQISPTPTRF